MIQINAKIIADSKNEFGNRITTMVVTFPRFILAELNTHRMLSKNSASSRAIPFRKMVKAVKENPFIPLAWQEDHPGMQGTKYLSKTDKYNLTSFLNILNVTLLSFAVDSKEYEKLKNEIDEKTEIIKELLGSYTDITKTLDEWWLFARDKAVEAACILYVFRSTKQLCNRLLEPFMYHTVILTGTEWENLFALRCPRYYHYAGKENTLRYRSRKDAVEHWERIKDNLVDYNKVKDWTDVDWLKMNEGHAEIHMMALAEAMWDAYNESTPQELKAGEWHIPFGNNFDEDKLKSLMPEIQPASMTWYFDYINDLKIKIATARCARVSYTVVGEEDKKDNYENDIKLYDRLVSSGHMSPTEHCAKAMGDEITEHHNNGWWSGNFKGFIQLRKTIPNENIL